MAVEFTLDTSGYVRFLVPHTLDEVRRHWSDLTPFQQGYVEALFADLTLETATGDLVTAYGFFRDLSPEALARIMGDCERFGELPVGEHGLSEAGITFWQARQWGYLRHDKFLPQRVWLDDSGKVQIGDAS
jgi:hypothetical protein